MTEDGKAEVLHVEIADNMDMHVTVPSRADAEV